MNDRRAVIFDWGGVLIDDPAPGLISYCASVLNVPVEQYKKVFANYAEKFQTDAISENELWNNVCRRLNVPVPETDSLWYDAFTAVYSPKKEVFELADSLQQNGCKTGFLSNTELPAMRYFFKQGYTCFGALTFSCIEKTAKPNEKIFRLTLEKLSCRADKAVFIDDNPSYIKAAQLLGLNTILFSSPQQVIADLGRFNIKI